MANVRSGIQREVENGKEYTDKEIINFLRVETRKIMPEAYPE